MEEVKAYKPKCCKKAYLLKSSAVRHEKNCIYNPDNKACATCIHRIKESQTVYVRPYPCNNPGDNDYDVFCDYCEVLEQIMGTAGASVDYEFNCKHWEAIGGD